MAVLHPVLDLNVKPPEGRLKSGFYPSLLDSLTFLIENPVKIGEEKAVTCIAVLVS